MNTNNRSASQRIAAAAPTPAPRNAGRKGQSRRYCVGAVQAVPLQLTWGRADGAAYGPLGRNSAGWFWLKDRQHPAIQRIIGPLEWIQWLTKRLNAYDTTERSKAGAARPPKRRPAGL